MQLATHHRNRAGLHIPRLILSAMAEAQVAQQAGRPIDVAAIHRDDARATTIPWFRQGTLTPPRRTEPLPVVGPVAGPSRATAGPSSDHDQVVRTKRKHVSGGEDEAEVGGEGDSKRMKQQGEEKRMEGDGKQSKAKGSKKGSARGREAKSPGRKGKGRVPPKSKAIVDDSDVEIVDEQAKTTAPETDYVESEDEPEAPGPEWTKKLKGTERCERCTKGKKAVCWVGNEPGPRCWQCRQWHVPCSLAPTQPAKRKGKGKQDKPEPGKSIANHFRSNVL